MATPEMQNLADLPISVPMRALAKFCETWQVIEFALFGSVLGPEFHADSDIDVLVTFDPEARPTLLTLARMERELERLFGRSVDLLERKGVEEMPNPYFRRSILESAHVIYAR